ncbi:hypothetical protein PLEOSDRAFT_1105500 [Pleurotus ostreatus PC15]|uniref:AAA+ ATPase domain-containing protein n=1 Tax=Pleurotus ostreatus (strain PC15) TaxID=1137138 RepID=A0A067NFG4_PLEO1|nr:hypothetical protein PLEOSDRAFT_1105500 [Pleurotus ostreatus PC15]
MESVQGILAALVSPLENASGIQNATVANSTISQAPMAIPSDIASLITLLFSFSALRDWIKLIVIGGVLETARRSVFSVYARLINSFFITATFDEDDISFSWMMVWLSEHPTWKTAREVEISTRSLGLDSQATLLPGEEEDVASNSRKLGFLPNVSNTYTLWYKHRWVSVRRLRSEQGYYGHRQETLIISQNSWRHVASRPKRPLKSIVLDPGIKDLLVEDAKDFLSSKPWYHERGIPFRRGYLLYGAPGSGKTSIIHSLAGELGLDVYIISLSRSGLDDSALNEIISDLPERCIALMEDIDAAFHHGLNRDSEDPAESAPGADRNAPPKPAQAAPTTTSNLSGLLNALDGVGAQEGRILFATTNKYLALDPALSRPGRMDIHIEFKLASKIQARELYRCFYQPSEDMESEKYDDVPSELLDDVDAETSSQTSDSSDTLVAPSPTLPEPKNGKALLSMMPDHRRRAPKLEREQIGRLAHAFADAVPEREFSMASLQGYLMVYKTRPFDAVKDVRAWVEKERADAARKAKAKVPTPSSPTAESEPEATPTPEATST